MTLLRRSRRRRGFHVVDVATLAPLALAPLSAYLGLVTGAAWISRARGHHLTRTVGDPSTRFTFVVPAHNEEQLIGTTVASLSAVDYPPDLFTIAVVADHCTDRTVEIARSHGAVVHEHVDPEPAGKGPAIQWLLDRLRTAERPYDVAVVIDADSIVNRGFLRVLDARFRRGAEVVQAYYSVRDPGDSTHAALRSAALSLRHYLRPLGRTELGASCGLYGNGMAFTSRALSRRRWSEHLTEDLEFQQELVLDGLLVDFAPDAVVSAEMPDSLEGAQTQNERWERGRVELARRYVPRLLRMSARERGRRRVALVDAAADLLVPPLSVLVAAAGATAATSWLIEVARPSRLSRLGSRVSAATCITIAVQLFSGLRLAGAPRAVYVSLLGAPRMIVWKVGLWGRMLVRPGDVKWVRTARVAEGQGDGS
jgi:cellulose synthase/poly-beta-1,6-N-acetylglucosamine synthase-like glycosyltransferase